MDSSLNTRSADVISMVANEQSRISIDQCSSSVFLNSEFPTLLKQPRPAILRGTAGRVVYALVGELRGWERQAGLVIFGC